MAVKGATLKTDWRGKYGVLKVSHLTQVLELVKQFYPRRSRHL
jgi:hypothetical protein